MTADSPLTRGKQPYVIDAVARMARRLGPGMKLPTIQTLAQELGVTIATVDKSLAKLESRGLINRKHGSGIYVSDRPQQKTIGVVFGVNVFHPGISPIYSIFLNQCERRVAQSQLQERYSLFLGSPALSGSSLSPIHHDLEEAIKDRKLDGLLLFAKSSGRQEDYIRESGVPMVALTGHSEWPGVVKLDSERLVRDAVEALRERGCRTIGFFGALPEHGPFFERAMKDAGLSLDKKWMILPDESSESFSVHQGLFEHEQFGQECATQLIVRGNGTLPDGLICTDDMITRGACPVFESQGLEIGLDFKLATHSNKGSFVLAEWASEMIQFAFDPQEIVDAMFSLLESHMQGQEVHEHRLITAHRY